jgi:tape measure domain-containing protein
MPTVAELLVRVAADVSAAERGLTSVSQALGRVKDEAQGASGHASGLGGVLDRLGAAASGVLGPLGRIAEQAAGFAVGQAAFMGLSSAVGAAGNALIGFNSRMEQAQVGFTTMLGSGEKAQAFLGELQKFAVATPFEFPDLVVASQRLLAMGISAQDVIPTLTAVGDAVAAMGGGKEKIDQVTTALGQMAAKGRVQADEMLQLTEAGIPAWDMLAKKLGTDIPTAMEMVTKGMVSAREGIEALTQGMEERFGGMMEKQSHTLAGALSNVKDGLNQLIGVATKPIFEALSQGAQKLAEKLSDPAFQQGAQRIAEGLGNALGRALPFIEQLATALASTLGPAVQQVASWIAGTLMPALQSFAEHDLAPKIQALGGFIQGTLVPAFQALLGAVSQLRGPLEGVIEFISSHKEILGGVAVAITALLVPAFVAWGVSAAAAAAATIVATAPVLAIGVAIAALAAGIIYLVKHWDDVTAALGRFAQAVADKGGEVLRWFEQLPDKIGSALADAGTWLLDRGKDLLEGLLHGIEGAWGAVSGWFVALPGKILGLLADAASWLVQKGQDAIEGLKRGIDFAWDAAKDFFVNLPRTILDLLGDAASWLVEKGKDAISGFKRGVDFLWDAAKDFFTSLGRTILGLVGDLGGVLFEAGKAVIQGLINGIQSMFGALGGALSGVGKFIADHKGPREVDLQLLVPAGRAIMEGLANGIAAGTQEFVLPALTRTTQAIRGGVTATLPALLGGGSGPAGTAQIAELDRAAGLAARTLQGELAPSASQAAQAQTQAAAGAAATAGSLGQMATEFARAVAQAAGEIAGAALQEKGTAEQAAQATLGQAQASLQAVSATQEFSASAQQAAQGAQDHAGASEDAASAASDFSDAVSDAAGAARDFASAAASAGMSMGGGRGGGSFGGSISLSAPNPAVGPAQYVGAAAQVVQMVQAITGQAMDAQTALGNTLGVASQMWEQMTKWQAEAMLRVDPGQIAAAAWAQQAGMMAGNFYYQHRLQYGLSDSDMLELQKLAYESHLDWGEFGAAAERKFGRRGHAAATTATPACPASPSITLNVSTLDAELVPAIQRGVQTALWLAGMPGRTPP